MWLPVASSFLYQLDVAKVVLQVLHALLVLEIHAVYLIILLQQVQETKGKAEFQYESLRWLENVTFSVQLCIALLSR